MSQTIIEKLLKGTEVEWKPLGEIAEIGTGSSNREDEKEGGQYPLYVRSKFILKSDNYEFDETAIIIPGEGGIGDIFHYVQGKYALHQRAYRIHLYFKDINSKFIYYFICESFKKYVSKKLVGSTSLSIRKPMLQDFFVPIPPLSVQKEIVRILDAFTAHTAELTAELNERKKQYNYYRDKLLTFSDDEVEWKPLGETFNIIAGGDIPKTELFEFEDDQHNIPVISNGIGEKSIYGWTSKAKIKEKSLTISARGTIGWTNYHTRPFFPIVRLLVLIPKININLKYTYFYMKSIENKYKIPVSSIPQLTKPMLVNISMPIPSLERQKRIVSILDKFDILTTSISEGLPREIELRNKQYEYYRDQLLNFPKPGDDAIKHSPTNV